jgi:hypothetical protein
MKFSGLACSWDHLRVVRREGVGDTEDGRARGREKEVEERLIPGWTGRKVIFLLLFWAKSELIVFSA